ncbi:Dabb family protein [Hymenobacter wooponensis]|nr:Dabb family protein [Hymenobacter wooponensis]
MTIPSSSDRFVHHVLFYTPATASEADNATLLEGLQKLAGISVIKMSHIGTPAPTNRDVIERTYTYSWLCLFENAAAEEEYQQHPIHDEFRNEYARYWEKVVIYDSIGSLSN